MMISYLIVRFRQTPRKRTTEAEAAETPLLFTIVDDIQPA